MHPEEFLRRLGVAWVAVSAPASGVAAVAYLYAPSAKSVSALIGHPKWRTQAPRWELCDRRILEGFAAAEAFCVPNIEDPFSMGLVAQRRDSAESHVDFRQLKSVGHVIGLDPAPIPLVVLPVILLLFRRHGHRDVVEQD